MATRVGLKTLGARWSDLVRLDRSVPVALTVAGAGLVWFAVGPLEGQRLAIRLAAPFFSGVIAFGQWRVGGDPRLPAASMRFWRILAFAMMTYTAGMVVDLVALVLEDWYALPLPDAGETLFYPIAGICTVVALVVFPTAVHARFERVKIALDVATVLFGSATFVWYFLVSRRWTPVDGWQELSDGLVLPALTLVAGFVILRITLAGANVISRQTMSCFVFGAVSAATPIIIGAPPDSPLGRVGSMIHVVGFAVCVVGVALQRRAGTNPAAARTGWRRSFSVLPYGAVAATLSLLLLVVLESDMDYRGWVVVVGVLVLCAAVTARQLASLWENSRLLTANRGLTERLRHQAFHDHLTGLANRALFSERVTEALAIARVDGSAVAVLFVDLDDFKIINDSLGHQIGDELLVAVAERLRAEAAGGHLLGRLGGDEFAVLVHDSRVENVSGQRGQPGAEAVAQRVIDALDHPFRLSGMQVNVRASVGIATAPPGDLDAAALLCNADVAMYAAKHADKGGWRVFQPQMLVALRHRHQLQAALAQAVARDEFVVYYQPIVRLVDGAVHGAEALVRWQRPDGSRMAPGAFIPLAEETGLVGEIDRLVLRRACRQAARWRAELPGGSTFSLHVNISARELHRADLAVDVSRILDESGLPADRLTLEITESGLGHDHEAAIDRLRELHRLGVRLAIDDFGTGYSSLAYLRRMPVDVLKIDKSFTAELTGPAASAPLAQAVIALASTLNMDTVAEGVEEAAQAERLLDLGCHYGQGFHYAPPLPPDDMAALVSAVAVRG